MPDWSVHIPGPLLILLGIFLIAKGRARNDGRNPFTHIAKTMFGSVTMTVSYSGVHLKDDRQTSETKRKVDWLGWLGLAVSLAGLGVSLWSIWKD